MDRNFIIFPKKFIIIMLLLYTTFGALWWIFWIFKYCIFLQNIHANGT